MFRRLKPYQWTVDGAVAAIYFGIAVGFELRGHSEGPLVVLFFAAGLCLRRFAPGIALALSWTGAALQMYVAHLNPGFLDFSILAVLYATALYGAPRVRWSGFGSIFLGSVVGAAYIAFAGTGFIGLRFDYSTFAAVGRLILSFSVPFVLLLIVLGLPWTAGNLVRTRLIAARSRRAQELAERDAEQAEQGVIVEQERNRIARDMHDVVAHSLAVVIAQADGARYARATDPDAVEAALGAISSTAREALGDVRLLLGQLRHSQSEGPQPGFAELERLLDQMRASGLTIGFESTGDALSLGTAQQLATYRIVQEALTNALRHGDVSRETLVRFGWRETDLEVTISNWITTKPQAGELRLGHGIAGMKERAALVGGRFGTELEDRRFVVRAFIPVSATVVS